jgi:hypothetical protein
MKTRSGFVSNSSSSSFVIIAPEEAYKKVFSEMTEYERAVMDCVDKHPESFFGKSVVVITGSSGNYSCWDDFDSSEFVKEDEDEDDLPYAGEVFDELMEKVKKASEGSFIYENIDC